MIRGSLRRAPAPGVWRFCRGRGCWSWGGVAMLSCWLASTGWAEDTVSPASALGGSAPALKSLLASLPPSIPHLSASLKQLFEAFEAVQAAHQTLKQRRLEQDNVKTELIAVKGTLELLNRERVQLEQQIESLDQKRKERLDGMRQELEARLQQELAQARQRIAEELEQDSARELEAFASRQHQALEQSAARELQFQEREIAQISQEVETLTEDLRNRLARLEDGSVIAEALKNSIGRVIAQRKAELQGRRERLAAQQQELLAKRREEFAQRLRQQQAKELQTRLMFKEANLRQAMAELLHQTSNQEQGALGRLRQALDEVKQRQAEAERRQTKRSARLQALTDEVASATRRLQELQATRGDSLARLESTLSKTNPKTNLGVNLEELSLLAQVIPQTPPELSSELGAMYQRLVAKTERERQLREQQRMLRERQLALELSREMERRYQLAQEQRQREQQARLRKQAELLERARQLQSRGQFDEALKLVTQAQQVDPAQAGEAYLIYEEILAAREQAARQAQTAQIERLFEQAGQAFEQGRYEQAVRLFEDVIAQEATLGLPREATAP